MRINFPEGGLGNDPLWGEITWAGSPNFSQNFFLRPPRDTGPSPRARQTPAPFGGGDGEVSPPLFPGGGRAPPPTEARAPPPGAFHAPLHQWGRGGPPRPHPKKISLEWRRGGGSAEGGPPRKASPPLPQVPQPLPHDFEPPQPPIPPGPPRGVRRFSARAILGGPGLGGESGPRRR